MRNSTDELIIALSELSENIKSDDGVASIVILEAAERLEMLQIDNKAMYAEVSRLEDKEDDLLNALREKWE